MFKKSKGYDPDKLLSAQKLINAEITQAVRREQGTVDAGSRNCANYIMQKNKNQALTIGKKMLEAKAKVNAGNELLKYIAQLKENAENIAKNQMTPEAEHIVAALCCGADYFKTDGLKTFKTSQMKEIFKSKASEYMKPEKLPEPLKTLFSPPGTSEADVVAVIRTCSTPFMRDLSMIDALFGPPPAAPATAAPVLEAATSSKYSEHVNLFTFTDVDIIPRERWNVILSTI